MQENWKSIINYPNYQISDLGRIRGTNHTKGKDYRYKKTVVNSKSGYEYCAVQKEDKVKNFTVHRIVAIHFIPNPVNLPEVNHKDGNKLNNKFDNLEWVTKAENKRHANANGFWKHTDKHKTAMVKYNKKNKSKVVLQFDLTGNLMAEHSSTEEAAKSVNASQGNVANCCNGKQYYKTVKGFIFKYK